MPNVNDYVDRTYVYILENLSYLPFLSHAKPLCTEHDSVLRMLGNFLFKFTPYLIAADPPLSYHGPVEFVVSILVGTARLRAACFRLQDPLPVQRVVCPS